MTGFVTTPLPVASHVPSVETKTTEVVGDGAFTEIVTGVPIDDAEGSTDGAVIWKAVEAPETEYANVRVSPSVATVTVAVPAVLAVTTEVKVPVVSVVPVAGESVTLPGPDVVRVTV